MDEFCTIFTGPELLKIQSILPEQLSRRTVNIQVHRNQRNIETQIQSYIKHLRQ